MELKESLFTRHARQNKFYMRNKHGFTATDSKQRNCGITKNSDLMYHRRRPRFDAHLSQNPVGFQNLSIHILHSPHLFLSPYLRLCNSVLDRLRHFLHALVQRSLPGPFPEQQAAVVAKMKIRYSGVRRKFRLKTLRVGACTMMPRAGGYRDWQRLRTKALYLVLS